MGRYSTTRPAVESQEIKWDELMHEALTTPGRQGETYIRGHDYSFLNRMRLYLQGVHEPTTSFKGWQKLGRHVMKGNKGFSILRPITVKHQFALDDDGQPLTYTKFKLVNGAFKYSQTDGEPLPAELLEPPEWSLDRALGVLGISLVKFTDLSLNTMGYSTPDREIAISPVAPYPLKTAIHELGHIEAGHTAPGTSYIEHRGLYEFEAEATAYLGMHDLGLADQMNPAESRAYIAGWLQGDTPPDTSIRKVFKVVDRILRAGYIMDIDGNNELGTQGNIS